MSNVCKILIVFEKVMRKSVYRTAVFVNNVQKTVNVPAQNGFVLHEIKHVSWSVFQSLVEAVSQESAIKTNIVGKEKFAKLRWNNVFQAAERMQTVLILCCLLTIHDVKTIDAVSAILIHTVQATKGAILNQQTKPQGNALPLVSLREVQALAKV